MRPGTELRGEAETELRHDAGTELRHDAIAFHLALAELLVRRGEHAAALQELHVVEELDGRPARPWTRGAVAVVRAERALVSGRPQQAQALVDAALDLVPADRPGLALRLCAVGLAATTSGQGTRCPRPQPRSGADGRTGDLPRRLMAVVDAHDAARFPGATTLPTTPVEPALVTHCRTEHARLLGRASPGDWTGVARIWRELREPFFEGYALWRCAQAALAAGDRDAGAAAARACQQLAAALDARPLLQKVQELAALARIRLERGPASPHQDFRLTPRESEVLAHLARGATNRQIAAALVISEKTAGIHVSNILAKLGVRNRGQAAAVAFRNGLCPEA